MFDAVRIINLVDRVDRRREMIQQLERLGGIPPNASFFETHRPHSAGEFPSVGARGCFESHLALLREARDKGSETLLVLEDDFDFTRGGLARLESMLTRLSAMDWSLFYGAPVLTPGSRRGLVRIGADEPVLTTSFVAFKGQIISELVDFLEAMQLRPGGSPQYGPMHVDGAYTVFRKLNPTHQTFVALPPLGRQRSSPSDISQGAGIIHRWRTTGTIAPLLRRSYNWLLRQ